MPGNVQSIERAAAIVRILAEQEVPRALGDLADLLSLSKSTAHGIVKTLVSVGFVRQNAAGDYTLGSELETMLPAPMDVNEMRARTTGWIDALAAKTGLSTRLVVLPRERPDDISHGLIVHHVFGATRGAQHVEIGEHLPLHRSAEGKVLLATAPCGEAVLSALERSAEHDRTAAQRSAARSELATVRRQGHAADHEGLERDTGGIAAPVRGHGGMVVAALGVRGRLQAVFGPRGDPQQVILDRLHEAVRGAARALMAERW